MARICPHRWSVKNILAFVIGGFIALFMGSPIGTAVLVAMMGALVGNQIGCVLDDIAKLGRPLGIAVFAWNVYDFLSGPPHMPPGSNYYKGAFLWAFASLSTFHSTDLTFFRIEKQDEK